MEAITRYNALVEAFNRQDFEAARREQEGLAQVCASLRKDGNFFATLKRELNKEAAGEGLFFGTPRSPIWVEQN